MNNIVLSVDRNLNFIGEEKDNMIYIIDNVNEYKEEIIDLIDEDKMSYTDLKKHIESWGGTIDLVPLREIVKNYKKSLL